MNLVDRLRIHLKDYSAAVEAADRIEALEAVARLSRDLLIELDTYWSGISGPSLSDIMLDWRNKYRILLEDGGVPPGMHKFTDANGPDE